MGMFPPEAAIGHSQGLPFWQVTVVIIANAEFHLPVGNFEDCLLLWPSTVLYTCLPGPTDGGWV